MVDHIITKGVSSLFVATTILYLTPEEIFVEDSEVEDEAEETVRASSSKGPPPRRPPKNSPPSKAARLPYFKQAWQQVTSNNFILNIVINGYKIQFNSNPVQINY